MKSGSLTSKLLGIATEVTREDPSILRHLLLRHLFITAIRVMSIKRAYSNTVNSIPSKILRVFKLFNSVTKPLCKYLQAKVVSYAIKYICNGNR